MLVAWRPRQPQRKSRSPSPAHGRRPLYEQDPQELRRCVGVRAKLTYCRDQSLKAHSNSGGIFTSYRYGIFSVNTQMEAISLKLPEALLKESSRRARTLGIPRAEYTRRALERMNREVVAQARAARLAQASKKVRRESMRINAEFARIEREPDA